LRHPSEARGATLAVVLPARAKSLEARIAAIPTTATEISTMTRRAMT
jgi:hypothetical protein